MRSDDDPIWGSPWHVLAQTPLGVALCGLDYRFRRVNPAFERLVGRTAAELESLTFADITHEDDRSASLEQMRELQVLGVFQTDKRYVRLDGTTLWAQTTVSALRGDDGALVAYLAMVHDVDQRHRAEEAVRESRTLLEESQRAARIGSYVLDGATGQWKGTAELERIFALEPGVSHDLDTWRQIIHPADRDRIWAVLQDDVIRHHQRFDAEYRVKRHADGAVRWVHGLGSPAFDDEGRLVRMLGTVQDITERREAEQALATSEATLRRLADVLDIGVFRSTLDGRFLHGNKALARLAGCGSVAELLELHTDDLYVDTTERHRFTEAIVRDGTARDVELRGVRRDGSRFPAEVSAVLLRDAAGEPEGVLGIVEDISARKTAELAMARTERLEALGVLAGGIAHDFNNLLAGLFGVVDLAEEHSTEPRVKELLGQALGVFGRARALTQQMLTFAKGGAPQRRVASIEPTLRAAVHFALSGGKVAPRFDVASDLWPADFDENQFAQVIDNLVINAQQAMPAAGNLHILARNAAIGPGHPQAAPGDYVCISVVDTGVGIPDHILPRIFDPFFTTKQLGSGLGLATAHSIVTQHAGFIDVASAVGEGTTVSVYLPAASHSVEEDDAAVHDAHSGAGLVLVMDDDDLVARTLGAMIRSLGYDVIHARHGEDALRLATERAGDLVAAVLDLTIPGGKGGRWTVAALRQAGLHVPVFAMSGYSNDPVMARPADFGFDDALPKPMLRAHVEKALTRHLAR